LTFDVDAILFDVDDTLYGYAPCNAAALDAVYESISTLLRIDRDAFDALHEEVRGQFARKLAGQAASHNRVLFFKRMVETWTGADDASLVLRMHRVYWDAFFATMRPAAGMHDVLGALAPRYKLALVSNHVTEAQLGKVHQLGVRQYTRVIVTSEEVGVEKPAAAMFNSALSRLGVLPGRALMVGDSDSGDIAGARDAGLWAVRTTEFVAAEPEAPVADARIASLAELPALLRV